MNIKRIVLAAMIALPVSSCSVLDDRESCPEMLRVSYDETCGEGFYFIRDDVGVLFSGTIAGGQSVQTFDVSGGVTYTAVFGLEGDDLKDGKYIVPVGCEPKDFSGFVFRNPDETSSIDVVPLRQCCSLVIDLEDTGTRDLHCIIESSTCGVDLTYLKPVRGEYQVVKYPADDRVVFTLFRQGFDDLKLRVIEDRFGSGLTMGTYSLTSLLDDFGYDWEAESLKDVRISVTIGQEDVMVEYI